ncbi:hypothetical protein [Paucisalibacillus globulus]|uniref:hypothetical protein n=1 Tax=Paucisalibacillus globulus TaxID=351095 RepID=UPI00041B2CAD|nr:hypothetical protein [Paucisalibacillus globulus]
MADNKSSEGKLIGGKRYCGKTTRLIQRASEEQLYILCSNETMARMIFRQAQDMGLEIPFPVTVNDLPLKGYMKEVLVDEVEMVLSQLVGKRVIGMSSSMEFEELESLNQSNQPRKNNDLKLNIECSEAIKGLKAIQREAKKATAALKEVESYPGTIRRSTLKADNEVVDEHFDYSLLTIDLFTIDSVPRVFYKGEEITGKIHVGFDWSTQTDKTVASPMIDIEYADTTSSRPSIKRITHNPLSGDSNV